MSITVWYHVNPLAAKADISQDICIASRQFPLKIHILIASVADVIAFQCVSMIYYMGSR